MIVENQNTPMPPLWPDDRLGSRDVARYLTDYLVNKFSVSRSSSEYESFVLNVNAEWGFGKTYVLTHWANELRQSGHPAVYFNAWESDFSENPLVAFISELETQLSAYFSGRERKLFRDAIKKGKKLLRQSAPALLEIAAKKLTGLSANELSALTKGDDADGASVENDSQLDRKDSDAQKLVSI